MFKHLEQRYGIRDIMIYDDTFVTNRSRVVEQCERLLRDGVQLTWHANARVDLVDSEMLSLMRRAGCWKLCYGIESGSQKVLDALRKGITLDQIRETLRLTRQAGILTHGYVMIGMLPDTRDTIRETIEFVLEADLDLVTVNHFTPFPNTPDYKNATHFGTFDDDWRLLNQHQAAFVPCGLSSDDIDNAIRELTRRFYLRPRTMAANLHLLSSWHNLVRLAQGATALLAFLLRRNTRMGNPRPRH